MSTGVYAVVPKEVAFDRELTLTDIRVYLAVAMHANPHRGAWPKQQTIADELGVSQSAVCKSLKRLIERGHLTLVADEVHHRVYHTRPIAPQVTGYEKDSPSKKPPKKYSSQEYSGPKNIPGKHKNYSSQEYPIIPERNISEGYTSKEHNQGTEGTGGGGRLDSTRPLVSRHLPYQEPRLRESFRDETVQEFGNLREGGAEQVSLDIDKAWTFRTVRDSADPEERIRIWIRENIKRQGDDRPWQRDYASTPPTPPPPLEIIRGTLDLTQFEDHRIGLFHSIGIFPGQSRDAVMEQRTQTVPFEVDPSRIDSFDMGALRQFGVIR